MKIYMIFFIKLYPNNKVILTDLNYIEKYN